MADEDREARMWDLTKVGVEAQYKFEFFSVGLAAAVLSFSVQFSKLTYTRLDWLVLAAWGTLLVSLIAGLFRLSYHGGLLMDQALFMGVKAKEARLREAIERFRTTILVPQGGGGLTTEAERTRQEHEQVAELVKQVRGKSRLMKKWVATLYWTHIAAICLGLVLFALHKFLTAFHGEALNV